MNFEQFTWIHSDVLTAQVALVNHQLCNYQHTQLKQCILLEKSIKWKMSGVYAVTWFQLLSISDQQPRIIYTVFVDENQTNACFCLISSKICKLVPSICATLFENAKFVFIRFKARELDHLILITTKEKKKASPSSNQSLKYYFGESFHSTYSHQIAFLLSFRKKLQRMYSTDSLSIPVCDYDSLVKL